MDDHATVTAALVGEPWDELLRDAGSAADLVPEAPSHFTWQLPPLPKDRVLRLLGEARRVLASEPNVIDLPLQPRVPAGSSGDPATTPATSATWTVVGDTHGQLFDVLQLFRINGAPSPANPHIFNGDFVDRGIFGVELCLLLLSLKLRFPASVMLLRGNHETRAMTSAYGFKEEALFKYDAEVLEAFYAVFDVLPLAAVLREEVLVLHGGLFSDAAVTLEHVRQLDRRREPGHSGALHDLLWSDPGDESGRRLNRSRGGGLRFGGDVTADFLRENGLKMLVRSHEVRQEGWSAQHEGTCVTVFSAPNYCDSMGNRAAVLRFDLSEQGAPPEVRSFAHVAHPTLAEVRERYRRSEPRSRL